MQKMLAGLCVMAVLVGCGSGPRGGSGAPAASTRGPIAEACLASDRKARSPQLCGCVQQVAHQTLSGSDQRQGAKFWRDPQGLQNLRQSDNSSGTAFWTRWKEFGLRSSAVCGQG
jgi:hypothetical protein